MRRCRKRAALDPSDATRVLNSDVSGMGAENGALCETDTEGPFYYNLNGNLTQGGAS